MTKPRPIDSNTSLSKLGKILSGVRAVPDAGNGRPSNLYVLSPREASALREVAHRLAPPARKPRPIPRFVFDSYVCEGESVTMKHEGFTITATVHADDDATPPWEREDGHGPVSDWTCRAKGPGEWVLIERRGSKRFYDFAEAVKLAKRDGWRAPGDQTGTPREIAARAAEWDFNVLRAWCLDEWWYCGIAVTVAKDDVQLVGEAAAESFREKREELRALYKAAKAREGEDYQPLVTLRLVPLDSGGYDREGTYFGIGDPLYWAATDDGSYDRTFRASDREAAKGVVRETIPHARFYR